MPDLLELVVIAIVALLVLGPKEMATAMRTLGRWMYKLRRFCSQVWTEIDIMMYKDEFKQTAKKMDRPELSDEPKDYDR